MFVLLGVLLWLYVIYAVLTGTVYAKVGPAGRKVVRADEAGYFWAVVVVYAGLALALVTVF